MPENENNDDVMNGDLTNLPEGDADMQGTGEDGMESGEGLGDGESGLEDGEELGDGGNLEDGEEFGDGGNLEDGEEFGDGDMMTDGDDMFSSIGGMDDMMGDVGTETGVKDPILSNVPFVAGTISVALIVGIVLGVLLGKKRIKKGFDLYEN